MSTVDRGGVSFAVLDHGLGGQIPQPDRTIPAACPQLPLVCVGRERNQCCAYTAVYVYVYVLGFVRFLLWVDLQ